MTPEQAAALRQPFPPELIGQIPKANTMLDYVGHATATDRLLQVDPDWSWEPMATNDSGNPQLDDEGNLWIRLTVAGVTRPGVGDGKNMKERIGDAIRNAAMRFGVALDLWAKEPLHVQEHGYQDDTPETTYSTKATKQKMVELFSEGGSSAPAQEAADLWKALVPDGTEEVSTALWLKLEAAVQDIVKAAAA